MERLPYWKRTKYHRLSHLQPTGKAISSNSQCSLSPFDLSGKSDIALRYKQRNKSQQSDHLSGCCSFFSAVNLSYSGKFTFSCHHARCHLSPKGRSCPLAEGGIFTWSRFPDLKKQAALAAPGTVPLLSDEKIFFFQVLDCPSHS